MLFLRLIGLAAAIAIGVSVLAWLFSGDKRYLGFAWRTARYALVFAFIIMALMFLERVL